MKLREIAHSRHRRKEHFHFGDRLYEKHYPPLLAQVLARVKASPALSKAAARATRPASPRWLVMTGAPAAA